MDPVQATAAAYEAAGQPGAQPIWIRLLPPAEVAALARAADPGRPLAGVPFAIKDNLDLAGSPTTAACPDLADGPAPTRSATAVQRLIDAGAVPVGKTNMDQFATGLVGTRSPHGACHSVASVAHVSGGSSSGSAIAVASGLVPLALGTDTAGSGRVPAAFNGIVGVKPTRGLVSTRGLLPACRSLDCVTTLTRTVSEARPALAALIAGDPEDPWSRTAPPVLAPGLAARMRVVAVPDRPLQLDPEQEKAWQLALERASEVAHVVPVDVSPFLEAAAMLYGGPFVAERVAAFGHLLDGPGVDPTVKRIVENGRAVTGAAVFAALDRLAMLRRATESVWAQVDALLLPVTPGHPTLAEVAADPIGANSRLGAFTNFVNLFDLCAIAVPGGQRDDGLPFGVQFIAPAFADAPLLDLAARWCGEAEQPPPVPAGHGLLAVCGAHLSGLPLNAQLVSWGGRLHQRARTAAGYRLYRLAGGVVARPGMVRTGDGPTGGLAVEVWQLPDQAIGAVLGTIGAPLGLGPVVLSDGTTVPGFLAETSGVDGAEDISGYGGWREYLKQRA